MEYYMAVQKARMWRACSKKKVNGRSNLRTDVDSSHSSTSLSSSNIWTVPFLAIWRRGSGRMHPSSQPPRYATGSSAILDRWRTSSDDFKEVCILRGNESWNECFQIALSQIHPAAQTDGALFQRTLQYVMNDVPDLQSLLGTYMMHISRLL